MFKGSENYYDPIYAKLKNYEAESEKIKNWIQQYNPKASTILDVACGTGEHSKYLKYHYKIDGIDINKNFTTIAQSKNPKGTYATGSFVDFKLNKKYDVVMCLFSAIGYALSLRELKQTLACFKKHLNPNGLILIEPWFTPEQWKPGRVSMVTAETEQFTICRMNTSELKNGYSFFCFSYLIGSNNKIQCFSEDHTMSLFTNNDMFEVFRSEGISVFYDEKGLMGRGRKDEVDLFYHVIAKQRPRQC